MQAYEATAAAHSSIVVGTTRLGQSSAIKTPAPKNAALLNALTIIVHDLRGPLANLSVLIELIETYVAMQAHERVKASTDKAQRIIESLDALLNGFLQRTRDTGDPLSYTPALLDVTDTVMAAAELNRPVAESRGITIDCSDLKASVIEGDKRLLVEAVDNLISNAVKYAPEGSTVTCETRRDGGDVVIAVSDAGQGLSELDLKRAFRPFATLSARYQHKSSSWGLGLWIVRLIAERHGGHVDVSARGQSNGARFEIRIPIERF
jgi:two-component system, OmpR family, sensor histidine kinase SenX3